MLGRVLRLLTVVTLLSLGMLLGSNVEAAPTGAPVTWHFADVNLSSESPSLGDVATVQFTVLDTTGAPVAGLSIEATLNPIGDSAPGDTMVPILSAIGRSLEAPGRYEVSLALNQPGRWSINILAYNLVSSAHLSQVISVNPQPDGNAPDIVNPVFLRADSWGTVYRLDPTTGSVASFKGNDVVHAGDRWWMTDSQLVPLVAPDPLYGGSWQLTVSLSDGVTGKPVSTIDLGAIRASVFIGSTDQPAVATAIAIAPDAKIAYVYWARQLGQGWLAWVATADPTTGQIIQQRMLHGSLIADSVWARIDTTPDGKQIIVAEQVARSTSVTGYRLTTLDATSLETAGEYRRTTAPDDPLTRCLIPYSGPTGSIDGSGTLRYSLCSPSPDSQQLALVTWDALQGNVVHDVDLASLSASNPLFVDGVSSPDGHYFYAVNSVTQQIAEVDMTTGQIVRQSVFASDNPQDPNSSPLDRFKRWLLGEIAPPAMAGILIQPGITIAPDGSSLYLVAPNTSSEHSAGNGIWVLDSSSLRVTDHILSGETIAGVVVTPSGQLAVVHLGSDGKADEISVVNPDGQALISLAIPDNIASVNSSH